MCTLSRLFQVSSGTDSFYFLQAGLSLRKTKNSLFYPDTALYHNGNENGKSNQKYSERSIFYLIKTFHSCKVIVNRKMANKN